MLENTKKTYSNINTAVTGLLLFSYAYQKLPLVKSVGSAALSVASATVSATVSAAGWVGEQFADDNIEDNWEVIDAVKNKFRQD